MMIGGLRLSLSLGLVAAIVWISSEVFSWYRAKHRHSVSRRQSLHPQFLALKEQTIWIAPYSYA